MHLPLYKVVTVPAAAWNGIQRAAGSLLVDRSAKSTPNYLGIRL